MNISFNWLFFLVDRNTFQFYICNSNTKSWYKLQHTTSFNIWYNIFSLNFHSSFYIYLFFIMDISWQRLGLKSCIFSALWVPLVPEDKLIWIHCRLVDFKTMIVMFYWLWQGIFVTLSVRYDDMTEINSWSIFSLLAICQ